MENGFAKIFQMKCCSIHDELLNFFLRFQEPPEIIF